MGNSQAKQQERRKHYEFPASHSPNTSLLSHDHTRYSNSIQVKLTNVSGDEAVQTGTARVHKGEMRMEGNDAFSDYIIARNLRSELRPPMLVSRRLHP
ncbi:hypothetical protein ACFXTH_010541 [Malus domestica]